MSALVRFGFGSSELMKMDLTDFEFWTEDVAAFLRAEREAAANLKH